MPKYYSARCVIIFSIMLASCKLLFSLFLIVLCGTSASHMVEVYAYTGGNAVVSCAYPAGYENYEKYLCTQACKDDNILVTTTQQTADRYSASDQHQTQIFTVTISNVQTSDAGKYWCGVSKTGKDIYTAVTVHVKSDECCDSAHSIQVYEGSSVSITCPHQREVVNSFKYVCKGLQPSTCRKQALVTGNTIQNTLELSTTITKQDAGSYLCGVERSNNFDLFSRVDLTVMEWCCMTSRDVKGFLGQSVILHCPYPPEHQSNTKFLCKGDQRSTCQNVVRSSARTDRFSLQEAHSSFSVTITGLRPADAGVYWCGSDSQWTAGKLYTKIQLTLGHLKVTTVLPTTTTNRRGSEPTHHTTTRKDGKTMISNIIFFVVPGLLLILVIVASVIVYKYSCLKTQVDRESPQTRPAKEEISINETCCNQDASKFTQYHRDNDQNVPQDEILYENFGNEPIYGNC